MTFPLSSLKDKAKSCVESRDFPSAEILIEQIANFTGELGDWLNYARLLATKGEYTRALYIIERENLSFYNLESLSLMAKCAIAEQKFEKALVYVDDENIAKFSGEPINTIARLYILRAQIFELQENTESAAAAYLQALKLDSTCIEAFNCLVDHHLVPLKTLSDAVSCLQFDSPDIASFYLNFYSCRLNVDDNIPTSIWTLSRSFHLPTNVTLLSCAMAYFFEQGQFNTSLAVSKHILKLDAMHQGAILHYIASSYELRYTSGLYSLSQSLIRSHPLLSISWYAVAAYYLHLNKIEECRKALKKATTLSRSPLDCPYAWLLLGHSFSVTEEHESAIQAYNTCFRLFPACRVIIQSLAVSHMALGNVNDAHAFLGMLVSSMLSANDLWSLNERGVLFYSQNKYEEALSDFLEITQCFLRKRKYDLSSRREADRDETLPNNVKDEQSAAFMSLPWSLEESAYRNAGHCLRKLKRHAEAKECFLKALSLMREDLPPSNGDRNTNPFTAFLLDELEAYSEKHEQSFTRPQGVLLSRENHPSDQLLEAQLYSSLGFVSFQLMQCQEAIQYFHQALMLNSEDMLSNQMLRIVMETVFRAPVETTWLHTGMAGNLQQNKPRDEGGRLPSVLDQVSLLLNGEKYLNKKNDAKEWTLSKLVDQRPQQQLNPIGDELDDDEMILD